MSFNSGSLCRFLKPFWFQYRIHSVRLEEGERQARCRYRPVTGHELPLTDRGLRTDAVL